MLSSRSTGGHRKTNNLDEVLPFNFFFFLRKSGWKKNSNWMLKFHHSVSCSSSSSPAPPPPLFFFLIQTFVPVCYRLFFSLTFSASFLFAQCSASTIFFFIHKSYLNYIYMLNSRIRLFSLPCDVAHSMVPRNAKPSSSCGALPVGDFFPAS